MEQHQDSTPAILVAVDGAPYAVSVLEQATRLAAGRPGVSLHIVHVLAPLAVTADVTTNFAHQFSEDQLTEGREYTRALVDIATRNFDGPIVMHLVGSDPVDGILGAAASVTAELIVIGTHDYRGLKRLVLGSVAAEVARLARCPVLVVRPLTYPTSHEPVVEPVCLDCVNARAAGAGEWCARHATHHPRAHVFYEYPQGFGAGSQLLRV